MLLLCLQILFGFLSVANILLQNKGYMHIPTLTILTYILFNLVVVLSIFIRKENQSNEILIQLMLIRIISTLCVQIGYTTLSPNNHDILLQKPVINYLLLNNKISYDIQEYNYTNSVQYAQYPITEIIISIIHLTTKIPVYNIQKYLAVTLSFLVVYPTFNIFNKLFKNSKITWFSAYVFLQTPWLIFFHSHIVHEFLAFTFLLYFLNYQISNDYSEVKKSRVLIEYFFIILITLTHHYTSFFMITILLFNFIIYMLKDRRLIIDNKVNLNIVYEFSKLFVSFLLILLWGLRPNNVIFKAILFWIYELLKNYYMFVLLIGLILFFSLITFIFLNVRYDLIRKMNKKILDAKKRIIENSDVILPAVLMIPIFLPFCLLKLKVINVSNILPRVYYYFISLSMITAAILYLLGLIAYMYNNQEKLKNKQSLLFIYLSFLFSIFLFSFYFIINWKLSVNVRERIQIFAFFFMSGFIGYFLWNINRNFIKKIRRYFYNFVSCFLLISIATGSMFYSFRVETISSQEIIFYADDYRLYPNEWEETALWILEHREYFIDKYIFSTYRGKIFIEGYCNLRIITDTLGIITNIFNETKQIFIPKGIYIMHKGMLKYPFYGSSIPIPLEIWNILIDNGFILYSTLNIIIVYNMEEYS